MKLKTLSKKSYSRCIWDNVTLAEQTTKNKISCLHLYKYISKTWKKQKNASERKEFEFVYQKRVYSQTDSLRFLRGNLEFPLSYNNLCGSVVGRRVQSKVEGRALGTRHERQKQFQPAYLKGDVTRLKNTRNISLFIIHVDYWLNFSFYVQLDRFLTEYNIDESSNGIIIVAFLFWCFICFVLGLMTMSKKEW